MRFLLVLSLISCGGGNTSQEPQADASPEVDAPALTPDAAPAAYPCDASGSSVITWSFDEGLTLAPTPSANSGVIYTSGVVAWDANVLATSNGDIVLSTDHGCTFQTLDTVETSHPLALTKSGAIAYAWDREHIYKIDGTMVAPAIERNNLMGLGINPSNPQQISVVNQQGSVTKSTDTGSLQYRIGTRPPPETFVYRAAFSPTSLDDVLLGTQLQGVLFSEDGGSNWQSASGIPTPSNVFNLVYHPTNPNIVWAMLLDIEESDAGRPGKWIYRSDDGGHSFAAVASESATLTLVNGPFLAPARYDEDSLYSMFNFQGFGSSKTEIYKFNKNGTVETFQAPEYINLESIGWSETLADGPMLMGIGAEDFTF